MDNKCEYCTNRYKADELETIDDMEFCEDCASEYKSGARRTVYKYECTNGHTFTTEDKETICNECDEPYEVINEGTPLDCHYW